MINLTDKTYKGILSAMLERIPDTYDKRDTSPIPTALGPAAWGLEGFYIVLNSVQGQAFIQTATGDNLDMLAIIANVERRQPSPAVRTGVFNIPVPIGTRFSTINGEDSINFTVTADTSTTGVYQLTAETPGTAGNDYVGPILPITPIPGLTSAQITNIIIPGDNVEDDDNFRKRIIAALNNPGYGGNIANYREWAQKVDGVGPVQVWPTWNGGGTVLLSILGSDLNPASAELKTAVENEIDPPPNKGMGLGLAPIGATVTVGAPEKVNIDVSATVYLSDGYTIDQVRPLMQAKIESYLSDIREVWGTPLSENTVSYNSDIYLARLVSAIISTDGVLNATDVTLNGKAQDLSLTETAQTQQVPFMGVLTLNE